MCLRKKLLRNNVLDEHRCGFDKVNITVPCGKCVDCRKSKSNDWLVRSYFEFINNDCQAFFVTLDFDNEHLPMYKGVPCFDSEIMKHFLKRLRNHIGKFRYLYATDYGGLLKRSHYHMMVMPDKLIDVAKFMETVRRCWICGNYTNIQQVQSVSGSKLKAIQYVVKYTTKDITWQPDQSIAIEMPLRFRPRTQASKGFGFQAIELGYITPEMIINCQPVALPIGKNGALVRFSIPRYYEMKLGFDVVWHPKEMKTEFIKNQYGVQMVMNKHNSHYNYYFRSFFSSRSLPNSAFPDELPDKWHNIVYNCVSMRDDFLEFLYYRPFVEFSNRNYYRDNIRNEILYRPNWSYYSFAVNYFDNYRKMLSDAKDVIETERMIEQSKARSRYKIQHNPNLRRYLFSRNYDFSQLY